MKRILMLLVCMTVGSSLAYATPGKKKAKRPSVAAEATPPPPPRHEPPPPPHAGPRGYGVSGCGLGSIVIGPKPGMIQIVAATLNGTGGQIFAITSGTSNCDIPEMGHQAAVFIEANKEAVHKEAARGQGETVRTIANMLNCHGELELGSEMKSNYEQYFGSDVNTYETVRRLINSNTCAAKG